MLLVDTGVFVAAADLDDRHHRACAALIDSYSDTGLDAADASIIAIAERLDQMVIATLDERDFRIVRPAHADAFDLLPGPG